MRFKGIVLLISIGLSSQLNAQKIFTEADLVSVVKKYHPIARQAMLDIRIAEANLTASRGAFDPVAGFDHSRKDFDGITYYDRQWAELKIPTWYGIDIYAGKEIVSGSRLNPDETKGTINYAGISIPLVQNLVMDKRRAALQQAKIYIQQSEVMRRSVLNDLMAEALEAYWDWWEQYQLMQVVNSSLKIVHARLEMVKLGFQLGDFPAIDTLEAATQVQFFEQQKSEAEMLLQNSMLNLSLFLWREGDQPFNLPGDVIPGMPKGTIVPALDSVVTAAGVHPLLMEYDYKLKGLAIEKKLRFQTLLPELRVKYNAIGRDFSKTMEDAFLHNNYRYGIVLSMPLRLSEGRGQFRAAKLKIEQTKLEQFNKRLVIQNKVRQYYNEWQQFYLQYQQQRELVRNLTGLQNGEETRFANGESSLFLVNSREIKTLEGQRKELSLAAKIQKAAVRIQWSAGMYGE